MQNAFCGWLQNVACMLSCRKLNLNENIANIWPEFGTNGKNLIKVWKFISQDLLNLPDYHLKLFCMLAYFIFFLFRSTTFLIINLVCKMLCQPQRRNSFANGWLGWMSETDCYVSTWDWTLYVFWLALWWNNRGTIPCSSVWTWKNHEADVCICFLNCFMIGMSDLHLFSKGAWFVLHFNNVL